MVSLVLGVGALGAALVGGGASGYFFWKKAEPHLYDAALHISYKAVFNREPSAAEQADSLYWKHCNDILLEDNQAVNVVVMGDYKQGKTFILNGMSGLQLETNYTSTMEGIKFKKTSWVSANKQDIEVLLIDTEGLNHLPGDPTNRELMAMRQRYDKFLVEVDVRLADLPVLVTEKPSLSLSQRVTDICDLMLQFKSSRTLVIVYNMCNIETKDDLFQFFEREVVVRFGCTKFEGTIPPVSYHYHTETNASGTKCKIVHLPIGREGSEAGKHFNKNTYASLRYLAEGEGARKEEAGERRLRVKEQLAALAPLFKRTLGVTLPKDPRSLLQYIPFAKLP